MASCSNCGAGLSGQFCARCGADNKTAASGGSSARSPAARADVARLTEKRHGAPALFSFFLPGLGQLAKGDLVGAALAFGGGVFLAALCSIGIGFVLLPILWIWNIYDAYTAPDGQTKRELKRLSNLAIILACSLAIAGCGSVTGDPATDSGTGGSSATGGVAGKTGDATGGAAGQAATGSGGQGAGGAAATGGASGACGGADLQTDPNNCGVCGNICPPAEQNKPNDSQQTCYQGKCYIPSGDVCTPSTVSECITTYCQFAVNNPDTGYCNPPKCTVGGSACPPALPNCDDTDNGYAHCTSNSAHCLCSTL